jgi:hypothetical protein
VKKFVLLILSLFSVFAYAGNEGRGTQGNILIGRAIKRQMTAAALATFEQRKAQLKVALLSPAWHDRLYSFVEQADPSKFLDAQDSQVVKLYRKMAGPALLADILATPIVIRDSESGSGCGVSEFTLEASTETHPGAEICYDVEGIALLELNSNLSQYAPHEDLCIRDFHA